LRKERLSIGHKVKQLNHCRKLTVTKINLARPAIMRPVITKKAIASTLIAIVRQLIKKS